MAANSRTKPRGRSPRPKPATAPDPKPNRKTLAPEELIHAALEARLLACAPYSQFAVGAALLTAQGTVITGANVESVSYGLTCCAERVALFKALTQGHSEFTRVAVVARMPGGATPCGACRQLLAEYAPNATVIVADSDAPHDFRTFTVRELLPGAFLDVPMPSPKLSSL